MYIATNAQNITVAEKAYNKRTFQPVAPIHLEMDGGDNQRAKKAYR